MESSAEPGSPEKVSTSQLTPATYGADADLDLQIAKLESQLRNYQARGKNINILFAFAGGFVILLGVFARQLLQGTALDKFSANGPLFGFGMGAYLLLLAG